MAEFIYTSHAEKRIKERNISKNLVEKTYYESDRVFSAENESERAVKIYDNVEIVVTFEELKRKVKTIKIISVHKKKLKGR